MTKRKGILIIVLISIVFILIWSCFPIGFNSNELVMKQNKVWDGLVFDYSEYLYNESTYIPDSMVQPMNPIPNSYFVYKKPTLIKQVYTSSFKSLHNKFFSDKYYVIGNEFIFVRTGFLDDLCYYNSELKTPEFVPENIKEISLISGEYNYKVFGAENTIFDFVYQMAINGETDCMISENVEIEKTYTDLEYIQNFVIDVQRETSFDSQNVSLYRLEFKDENFPFYLICRIAK